LTDNEWLPTSIHSAVLLGGYHANENTGWPGRRSGIQMCSTINQSKSPKIRHLRTIAQQTDKQTDRHYENNGHLAVNQLM